jgi:hypothetical protein
MAGTEGAEAVPTYLPKPAMCGRKIVAWIAEQRIVLMPVANCAALIERIALPGSMAAKGGTMLAKPKWIGHTGLSGWKELSDPNAWNDRIDRNGQSGPADTRFFLFVDI